MRQIVLIIAVLASIYACKNEGKNSKSVSEKEILRDSIVKTEKNLHSDESLDKTKAMKILNLYEEYFNNYEKDSLSAEYLFRATEIAVNINQPAKAINYLKRIKKDYPDYKNYPYSIYLIGFIYDSMLNQDKKAEVYYDIYLKKYPDHERAEEVKKLKEYLGLSDLELVEKFEKQNQENQ